MRSYTVFQFTQRAIENRSTCHAWHACSRLPTPGLRKHGKLLYNHKHMKSVISLCDKLHSETSYTTVCACVCRHTVFNRNSIKINFRDPKPK
jgi:hypothetical protein